MVNGATHVWEVRDLAGLKYEEGMPGDIRARMVVNLFPPAGESTSLRPFKTWQDISKFLSELSDPQSTYNAVMERRARELRSAALARPGAKGSWTWQMSKGASSKRSG